MTTSSPNGAQPVAGWRFVGAAETFALENAQATSYLYFPLVNEAGMVSVVTPTLHGDVKAGQHAFLTPPTAVEDLHLSRGARNFWVTRPGAEAWSVTGNSAPQTARRFSKEADTATVEAGLLWHRVTRRHAAWGLQAVVTNVVPAAPDRVELMQVELTNTGDRPLTLTPTAAIPLYGRSADNLRDHRHVTALLHRIQTHTHGVLVRPTLSFDERGHQPNATTYAVLGSEGNGRAPVAFFPTLADFVGEGGTLDWPAAVVGHAEGAPVGTAVSGYEAFGGLRFAPLTLQPGQRHVYVLILAIFDADAREADRLMARWGSEAQFAAALAQTEDHWQEKLGALATETAVPRFDRWLRWVALQPSLRRLCGNSFLPYHDYGRGGRGWRDLWQDLLALLLMEPAPVRDLLFSNFAGVRLDGSNATIIGSAPGEFKADRNNIPRVWMDHGAWPWLTTRLYLDQTGDLDFLLRTQAYFKDQWTHRAQKQDTAWQPEEGTQQRTASGGMYAGTILEHLLVQHLTAFFNVGEHNIIRLEGADWNDGLDMAAARGESAAFSALYAGNLRDMSTVLAALAQQGVAETAVAQELLLLLDTLSDPVDYASATAKQQRLAAYFDVTHHTLSGEKASVPLAALARDLAAKAAWLTDHLRAQEWLTTQSGAQWYNGYYDNAGLRLEGDHPRGPRMTLTAQTFALLGGVATDAQAQALLQSADAHLFDAAVGGYRLNTDFDEVLLNLGRAFGFAFGHKENGAMFSHMAVMFAYALYQRGLAHAGYRVLDGIYQQSQNFAVSRIYPGIPEYFDARGRGLYPFLTGSASWYLLTWVTQAFGVQGRLGELTLTPRLVRQQFGAAGTARLETLFAGRSLAIVYHNPEGLDFGEHQIGKVVLNGTAVPLEPAGETAVLPRALLTNLDAAPLHQLDVYLVPRQSS